MFYDLMNFIEFPTAKQGALTTLREANSELREAQADLRAYPATSLKPKISSDL